MMQRSDYEQIVASALSEDLGARGDITSQATVPADASITADLVARMPGTVAGLAVASYVFETVDDTVDFTSRLSDGDPVVAGSILASVSGSARSILAAERTALNLLGRMSGVATATARLVKAVAGTGARITDTRKTMPGLRALDKYSVAVGGGVNHRMGLHGAVMIKDNHLASGLSIEKAVSAARSLGGPEVEITVEVEDLDQLRQVLGTDANRILLDNMGTGTMKEAVRLVGGGMLVEASGGITAENARSVAETGVDLISVGWITHSAPQLDIALDFRS